MGGSVSLALRRSAILRVQSLKVLDLPINKELIQEIARRIEQVGKIPLNSAGEKPFGLNLISDSNRIIEGRKIAEGLSLQIPGPLREHFYRGALKKLEMNLSPEKWARWVLSMRELALNPVGVLNILRTQPWVLLKTF